MKFKFWLILFAIVLLTFSGCSKKQQEVPVVVEETKEIVEVPQEEEEEQTLEEIQALFNVDLEEHEEQWRAILQDENPNVKIYHIKSVNIACEDCYEVYYKKDRSIVKYKVLNGELQQKTTIVDDLFTEIDTDLVCKLFSGTWNDCPKVCETDEEACATLCGLPVCEFDEDKVELQDVGDLCGGLEYGDCKFGLTCHYDSPDDDNGFCREIY